MQTSDTLGTTPAGTTPAGTTHKGERTPGTVATAGSREQQRPAPRDDKQAEGEQPSVPYLRYAGARPGSPALKPEPLTGQELADNYPMVMSRIQEGLREENGIAIRRCLSAIAAPEGSAVAFDVTVNVAIDGEVGTVDSIEFPDPPEELAAESRACLSEVMASLSFNGMDVAFEGPVNYPFIVRSASTSGGGASRAE